MCEPKTFTYVKYDSVMTPFSYLHAGEALLTSPLSWPSEYVQAGKGSYGKLIFYKTEKPNLGRIEYNGLIIENGKLIEIKD